MLEPELHLDARRWSWSLKFEYRLHSPAIETVRNFASSDMVTV